MKRSRFVDFAEVRRVVTMAMLVDHYGIDWLRKTGDELRGRCPIHAQAKGERAFHISLEKNVFNCFSCGAKGSQIDFCMAMEGISVRAAALKMQEWFLKGELDQRAHKKRAQPSPAKARQQPEKPADSVINPPLGFKLRVDSGHEYGQQRGFSKELLQQFGAGFCLSKGMFSGRFVFELRDAVGRLVGYSGRSIDNSEPKYLMPSSKKGFQKRHLLWNFHREVKEVGPDEPIVIVEGIWDALRVKEVGYPCIALLGSSLSKQQENLIAQNFSRAILLLDGDQAGRIGTDECLRRLGRRMFVKALTLPEDQQPDTMSREEVVTVLLKGTEAQLAAPT